MTQSWKIAIPAGHIARNVAPVGEAPRWEVQPMPADWNRSTQQFIDDQARIFGLTWDQIDRKQRRA